MGGAIEGGNVVGGKEASADVADETTDSVHGKDVEGIVNAQEELELSSIVGERGSEDAENDSRPDRDITCDYQSCNFA